MPYLVFLETMMKTIIIILAAMVLSACSSMKTSSDYDPKVNFSDVKTYAWIEKKQEKQAIT